MKLLLIAVGAIALMASGFIFIGGAAPAIVVAPEIVFHAGPVDITNTMFTSWWVVIILCVGGWYVGRNLKLVPTGFAGGIEAMIEAFYGIVVSVAGEKNGRRFFPLVATIFFFVLASNYFGLLPMNNIIGKPEPDHTVAGKQVVFGQAQVPLLGSVAYIPFKPQALNIAGGDHAILPEGYVPAHGAADSHAPADPKAPAAPAKHNAVTGTSEAVASSDPRLAPAASAPAAEEVAAPGAFSGALAPYFRSVNTDINAPLAIAIFSFIFVEFWGLQTLGPGYLKKFFAFDAVFKRGPMGLIDVFVGILEFVSELSRMVSFTFRLFGNIFAGEVLLLMMSFLVPFLLVDVFYALELFVGLIQAFVFAILTLVFAVTAVSHHGDEEHHAEATEHHGAH
jgi:F-type H+-transporting ATPase subunit a